MSAPSSRSFVVAMLAAVVAFRVAGSEPANGAAARVAQDPGAALRQAGDGWTTAGTLGESSAAGIREVPLALFHWIGNVFALGPDLLHPAWRVFVLVLAVLGAVRLARGLTSAAGRADRGSDAETHGHDAPWTPWVAAAVYACGPVLVATTVLSPMDGLAAAAMPWILAPLLRRDRGWRAAASSAVWVGAAGVASPTWATAALLAGAVAALPRARSEVRQFLRWAALTAVASAWWIAAGIWEANFATDVSTLVAPSGLKESLGAVVGEETWGWPALLLVTLWPAGLAVAALALRPPDLERRTIAGLLGLSFLGLAALGSGGWTPPVLAPNAASGAAFLAPVLALLWLSALLSWQAMVAVALEQVRGTDWSALEPRQGATVVVTGVLIAGTVLGAAAVGQEPDRSEAPHEGQAEVWDKVRSWSLDAPPGRVLVLPATQERTDPVVAGALAGRPWIARDALPTSGGAATRALDDLLGRLSRGYGDAGTAVALRRLGIAYVLLRDDLPVATARERPIALVRSALESATVSREAVLSAESAGDGAPTLLDRGVRSVTPQVEVWAVPDSSSAWELTGNPLTVAGDAGSVSDLAAVGALDSRPVRLVDAGRPEAVDVVSDSARRQDVDQASALDPFGPLLGADEEPAVAPPDAAPSPTASLRIVGAKAVSASSSAADLGGAARRVGSPPSAAVDGNAFTSWQSRRGSGVGQWWEIEFEAPVELAGTTIQTLQNAYTGHTPTRVRLTTDGGEDEVAVPANGLLTLVEPESTTTLRVTAVEFAGVTGENDSFGITEVSTPEVAVRDELVVEGPPTDAWVLAARPSSRTQCVPVAAPPGDADASPGSATVCDRGLSVDGPDAGSMDRVIVASRGAAVTGSAWVRAAGTDEVAALADRLAQPSIRVTGSSSAAPDLVTRPQAAADGDADTAWRPTPEDPEPTLTLAWDRPARVTGLSLRLAPRSVASRPTKLVVTPGAGSSVGAAGETSREVEVAVGRDGSVVLPPMRTDSLTVTFLENTGLTSTDAVTGAVRAMPMAVAEVAVRGGPEVTYRADDVSRLRCGRGPGVTVGVREYETTVEASPRELVTGASLPARLCSQPRLVAGENEVAVEASFSWWPLGLLLTAPEGGVGPVDQLPSRGDETDPRALAVDVQRAHRGETRLRLEPGLDTSTVMLAVPVSKGWIVKADGEAESSVTVDGWSQGWLISEGESEVMLSYSAGTTLRWAVGLGGLAWLAVLALASASVARSALSRRAKSS